MIYTAVLEIPFANEAELRLATNIIPGKTTRKAAVRLEKKQNKAVYLISTRDFTGLRASTTSLLREVAVFLSARKAVESTGKNRKRFR